MRRVGIGQIVKETGLSRATVDRALNGRGGVHARTRAVIDEALRRLQLDGMSRSPVRLVHADLALRVGRGFLEQMKLWAPSVPGVAFDIHDLYQASDEQMLEAVTQLCRDTTRPLVLTAKNCEPLRAALVEARRRGKRVVTFISDLNADCRDGYVGIDNRMAGQTAAFIIGNLFRHRPAKAGVVLGDYAYSCHEDREIGFRSNLRAYHPTITLTEAVKGEDSSEQTYLAVRHLLGTHPDLDAIYNVAGGNAGLAQAVAESPRARAIHVITHETNHITVPLLRRGGLHYAIAQHPGDLLARTAAFAAQGGPKELNVVDFAVYTPFNIPYFAVSAPG